MAKSWHATCKVFYVPSTTKFNKKGEPVLMRVTHRALYLSLGCTVEDACCGDYRIVYRRGKYTISTIPRKEQSMWQNPLGHIKAWYVTEPDTYEEDEEGNVITVRPWKRTQDAAMDDDGILRWLGWKLGKEEATRALHALLTCEPENQKQAA